MILAQINHIATAFVLALRQFISTHVLYYTVSRYLVRAFRTEQHPPPSLCFPLPRGGRKHLPNIPTAKAGGFTATLGN